MQVKHLRIRIPPFFLTEKNPLIRDRSLFIASGGERGGGGGGFQGDHLIFERKKGGIAENFGRIQRGGTSQICLENEDMGGGIAKVIKSYKGGSLQ